MSDMYDQ